MPYTGVKIQKIARASLRMFWNVKPVSSKTRTILSVALDGCSAIT